MQVLFVTIHIIAAVLLILIVLLQQGKGGMTGLFGGGTGMEDMLASPGSDVFLKKITITLAAIFFFTSLILAVRTSRQTSRSLLERRSIPVENQVPAESTNNTE